MATDEALATINRMSRAQLVKLLEDHAGIQCYDDESMEVLQEAARVNYEDGTLSADDVAAVDEK